MILTASAITENIKSGNIVISPFNEEQLNPNSYDLRLLNKLLVYEMIYNDDRPPAINTSFFRYFLDSKKENPYSEIIIPEEGYVLIPNRLYLGSTVEYTETHSFVPMIEGKSSIGRLGIDIHKTAGFGDLSFCGMWTLEITVVQPIKIYPNMKIAQIFYTTVQGEITKTYNGKYQNQNDIIASKAYRDF